MPPVESPSLGKGRILVVDDEPEVLEILSDFLSEEGYEVSVAPSAKGLRGCFEGVQPDVVLLDLKLPDGDGIDLLPAVKKQWPETEVIVLTGFATVQVAVEAVKGGAFYFLAKPLETTTLLPLVQRACEHKHLQETVPKLSGIFESHSMKDVVRLVRRFAASDASMLITGESGTGKEVVADLVHSLSPRSQGQFVKVNCAALPRELIESELFGSVKGAYTGAHADREGLFRQAQGGTILLDEISEMPLDTQSKLLRVLQEKEFRPVGGKASMKADCRVIASTNRRPEDAMRDSKLREDLFYRISAITIHLPPLRERRDDILPLARAFLKRFAAQAAGTLDGFTKEAEVVLERYDWPGNVRQLENEIQRAVLVSEGKTVDVQDLSIGLQPAAPGAQQGEAGLGGLEVLERKAILEALERTGGNKAAAARELGVTRQTLYNKMRYYSLNP